MSIEESGKVVEVWAWKFLLKETDAAKGKPVDLIVPDTKVGRCLVPEGNGVSSGEGGEGGLSHPKQGGR
jgi:hypothetical protein